MLKQNILIVLLVVLFISFTSNDVQAAEKYRLGLQGTHTIGGLSGIMELTDPWAAQVVLNLGVDAFALRALNRFHRSENWNTYGAVAIAMHKNNDLGLGASIGLEYDWRGLDASLPPIGWNIELGASIVPDFNLDIGFGIHWKFK